MCGVACYVRHNRLLTKGQPWGEFLEARVNAADCYRRQVSGERRWARARFGRFGIFCSSSTDPYVPQEERLGVTASVLEAMLDEPPDVLILQTHSHRSLAGLERLVALSERCEVRLHLSIETDRESIDGLPPHSSSVDARLSAARRFRAAGVRTVITVAPLLPIEDPTRFFERVAGVADGVIIDHFIGGDGSGNGSRTQRTILPIVMEEIAPGSTTLAYRDRMVEIARSIMPGRVGVSAPGFAGIFE